MYHRVTVASFALLWVHLCMQRSFQENLFFTLPCPVWTCALCAVAVPRMRSAVLFPPRTVEVMEKSTAKTTTTTTATAEATKVVADEGKGKKKEEETKGEAQGKMGMVVLATRGNPHEDRVGLGLRRTTMIVVVVIIVVHAVEEAVTILALLLTAARNHLGQSTISGSLRTLSGSNASCLPHSLVQAPAAWSTATRPKERMH